MRLRLIVKTGPRSAALALAALSLPALAEESQPTTAPAAPVTAGMQAQAPEMPQPPVFSMPPQARADWLNECSHRLSGYAPYSPWYDHRESWRGHHKVTADTPARAACETYLNDYYAYYATAYANYVQYIQAYNASARAACNSPCYREKPMRPAARKIPKRAKIVPDKRIPLD